jgi:acyl carrier protein
MNNDKKMELLKEGLQAISADSKVDLASVTGSTSLSSLGLDSLDIVELLMYYEDKTGKTIPDPSKDMKTVDDLLKLLPENV